MTSCPACGRELFPEDAQSFGRCLSCYETEFGVAQVDTTSEDASRTCPNCGTDLPTLRLWSGAVCRACRTAGVTGSCSICRREVREAAEKARARCSACDDVLSQGGDYQSARKHGLRVRATAGALTVFGAVWWECSLRQIVTSHDSLESVNAQALFAADNGWQITSMTVAPGHLHVGRTLVGGFLAGPLGAAAASGRAENQILVSWRRDQ